MTHLAQQELMEPEPARTVVLPSGTRKCWWGVDAATARFNVGWVAEPGSGPVDGKYWEAPGGWMRGVQAVRLGAVSENEGQRLNMAAAQARALVHAMAEAGIPLPGVVYLEHPAGQYPKPMLYYVVGVAGAAIYDAVRQLAGWVPSVEFTTSGHWKLVAVGHGKQPKPKFGKPGGGKSFAEVRESYGVLAWARINGYDGEARDCWDDADSLALAECARRDIAIRS